MNSHERFLDAYRHALDWLRAEKLPVKGSRFEAYEGILARIAAEGGISKGWTPEDVYLGQDGLLAGMDLTAIHEQFGGATMNPGLRSRLKLSLRGDGSEREERPGQGGSTQPRDIGFEVVLGAHLKSVVIEPIFPKIGDLGCSMEGCAINVECKRPQGEAGVEDLVRKGAAQLRDRAAIVKALPVSVVALSVGKLERKGELMLVAPSPDAAREEGFRRIAATKDRLEHLWQPDVFPGLHAVLLQLEVPIHIQPTGDFLAGTFHVFNPILAHDRGPEVYAVRRVVERLQLKTDRRY